MEAQCESHLFARIFDSWQVGVRQRCSDCLNHSAVSRPLDIAAQGWVWRDTPMSPDLCSYAVGRLKRHTWRSGD